MFHFITMKSGVPSHIRALVVRYAAEACARSATQAWVYLVSDEKWPAEIVELFKDVPSTWRQMVNQGGVFADLGNPGEVALFAAIAPYSIEAEMWREEKLIFEARDAASFFEWHFDGEMEIDGELAELNMIYGESISDYLIKQDE